jgi:hypothetical protein
LDTREKILSVNELEALLGSGEWVIAVGQFDPLTTAQAKRLSAFHHHGGKLLAIVLEGTQALLSGNARATLIAALRDVDAVMVAERDCWPAAIPDDAHVRVVEDAEGEAARSADFVRYIVERQAAAASNGGRR